MWILVGLIDPMVDLEKWCIKDVQVMYKNHFSLNFSSLNFSFLKNKNKNKQLDVNEPQDENTWRWTTENAEGQRYKVETIYMKKNEKVLFCSEFCYLISNKK
jgi:hypothetical protein